MLIRIATRKSKLALIQTNLVIDKIKEHFPEAVCEVMPIVTTGDKIADRNLYDIGGKALFLKELEEKLLAKEADIAVHSLKDVPGILPKGLKIAAVLEREDPRDCLVSYKYKSLSDLPHAAVIGSSSVRRKVVLKKLRPDLQIVQLRGNIDTRIRKLREEAALSAIILACAGLKRAGLFNSLPQKIAPSGAVIGAYGAQNHSILNVREDLSTGATKQYPEGLEFLRKANKEYCFPLSVDEMIPSAGQGTVAIEIRSDDSKMIELCSKINHLPTWYLTEAEREFLAYFDASCRTPIAAYAEYIEDGAIKARYMYGDFEESFLRFHTEIGVESQGKEIAIKAAKALE